MILISRDNGRPSIVHRTLLNCLITTIRLAFIHGFQVTLEDVSSTFTFDTTLHSQALTEGVLLLRTQQVGIDMA